MSLPDRDTPMGLGLALLALLAALLSAGLMALACYAGYVWVTGAYRP